jgi:hypothetical protein
MASGIIALQKGREILSTRFSRSFQKKLKKNSKKPPRNYIAYYVIITAADCLVYVGFFRFFQLLYLRV